MQDVKSRPSRWPPDGVTVHFLTQSASSFDSWLLQILLLVSVTAIRVWVIAATARHAQLPHLYVFIYLVVCRNLHSFFSLSVATFSYLCFFFFLFAFSSSTSFDFYYFLLLLPLSSSNSIYFFDYLFLFFYFFSLLLLPLCPLILLLILLPLFLFQLPFLPSTFSFSSSYVFFFFYLFSFLYFSSSSFFHFIGYNGSVLREEVAPWITGKNKHLKILCENIFYQLG